MQTKMEIAQGTLLMEEEPLIQTKSDGFHYKYRAITEKASQLQHHVNPPKLLYTRLSPIKVYRAIPQSTAHS